MGKVLPGNAYSARYVDYRTLPKDIVTLKNLKYEPRVNMINEHKSVSSGKTHHIRVRATLRLRKVSPKSTIVAQRSRSPPAAGRHRSGHHRRFVGKTARGRCTRADAATATSARHRFKAESVRWAGRVSVPTLRPLAVKSSRRLERYRRTTPLMSRTTREGVRRVRELALSVALAAARAAVTANADATASARRAPMVARSRRRSCGAHVARRSV